MLSGWVSVWLCAVGVVCAQLKYYDAFTGAELSAEQRAAKEALGADSAFWCMNAFAPCSATEGRRLDGSCNNLASPGAGAAHQPFERLLPARYAPDGYSKAVKVDGTPLPLERAVRTAALTSAVSQGGDFSQLSMMFNIFVSTDFTPITAYEIVNYAVLHPKCCTAKASEDNRCAALSVPPTDVLTRQRGISCMNHTLHISFQSKKCIDSSIKPAHRINYGSAHLDLKSLYGIADGTSTRQRLFKGGKFNFTAAAAADGLQWPTYTVDPVNTRDGLAGVGGVNYFIGIIFWREHNRIATELEKLNPSWTDDQLFETARDINIAQYSQIFFYENLPDLFGYDNMLSDGVISADAGFRDVYSASVRPGWTHESLYVHRWFHSLQSGNIGLYSPDGVKQGNFPPSLIVPASTFNSGNNFSFYAQALFRATSAKKDNLIDPFLGETALWPLPTQVAADLGSFDIASGRQIGLAPYVDFLELCEGRTITDWDDLAEDLDEEAVEALSGVYGANVRDLELMPALWRENTKPGAQVPKTLYCLSVKQLLRNIQSDRHWYERQNRPNAFTAGQLAEIRKSNIARIMCDNTRDITTSGITARALRPISAHNPIVSCSSLPVVDLSQWKDNSIKNRIKSFFG